MSEVFEFFPEPKHDQQWWDNLSAVVNELATLLANRPGKVLVQPKPVASVVTGTLQVSNLPRATMVQNERVYTFRDIAQFCAVHSNWLTRQEKLGRIKTFTPDHVRHNPPKRKRKYVKHADLLDFLGRAQ